MTEPMRVRWLNGFWVVELFSLVTSRWIVHGEHLTKEAAEADRKSWLVERGVEWKPWAPSPAKLPEVSRASHYS